MEYETTCNLISKQVKILNISWCCQILVHRCAVNRGLAQQHWPYQCMVLHCITTISLLLKYMSGYKSYYDAPDTVTGSDVKSNMSEAWCNAKTVLWVMLLWCSLHCILLKCVDKGTGLYIFLFLYLYKEQHCNSYGVPCKSKRFYSKAE